MGATDENGETLLQALATVHVRTERIVELLGSGPRT